MRILTITIVSFLLLSTAAEDAFARRDRRQGFNFGVTLGLGNADARTIGAEQENASTNQTRSKTDAVSASPYMGYVFFDRLNIGLQGLIENSSSEQETSSAESGITTTTNSKSQLKAGSLFFRFLFGKIMYFEAGAGVYEGRSNIETRTENSDTSGSFTGTREDYNTRGLGPGFHGGVGLEISVLNGFYFTSNFLLRSYQLREFSGGGSLGKKRGSVSSRELSFGISHYVD